MNDLRNDPALAGKVDWQAVDAEFSEWDYKSQGLTEAGAALVTLVATALTAGTGVTAAPLSVADHILPFCAFQTEKPPLLDRGGRRFGS